MLVLPADHLIEKNKIFTEDVILAKQAQKQGIYHFWYSIQTSRNRLWLYLLSSKKAYSLKMTDLQLSKSTHSFQTNF